MERERIAVDETQVNSLSLLLIIPGTMTWIGSVNPKYGWCDGPMVI